MISLTWTQVNAWRLSQHYLLNRAPPAQMLDVVSRVGGIQAQVMSAAELAIWARCDIDSPQAVQEALWQSRTLLKTWALRGTLHLLASRDFPLFVGALSSLKHFTRASWQKYHGVTLKELEAIIGGVRNTLTASGMTREQLATAIAEQTGLPKLAELLRSGWGAILKPVSFQGLLCFGNNDGQNVTFVSPAAWLGAWEPVEVEAARKEVARRYLSAYGPNTPDEFARWFGFEPADAKRIFRALGSEVEAVDVEGWQAFALASSVPPIQDSQPRYTVRLLPNFDAYVIALYRQSETILPTAYAKRVSRPQGWISAVVLENGQMVGVWEYDKQRTKIAVNVELFNPPSAKLKRGIETEAERLGKFLGGTPEISYA